MKITEINVSEFFEYPEPKLKYNGIFETVIFQKYPVIPDRIKMSMVWNLISYYFEERKKRSEILEVL